MTHPLHLESHEGEEGVVPAVHVNLDEEGNIFIYQAGEEVLIDSVHVARFLDYVQRGEPS